jgi:hypothetical protein
MLAAHGLATAGAGRTLDGSAGATHRMGSGSEYQHLPYPDLPVVP